MMPCCSHTYAKYLNSDKTVNEEALRKILEEDGLSEQDIEHVMLNTEYLCKCTCHVIGTEVIH